MNVTDPGLAQRSLTARAGLRDPSGRQSLPDGRALQGQAGAALTQERAIAIAAQVGVSK